MPATPPPPPVPKPTVKAFVVHATYRVEGKGAYVYLYGRQEDGKTFLTRSKFKPYFFIKKNDQEQASYTLAGPAGGAPPSPSEPSAPMSAATSPAVAKFERAARKTFADETLVKVVLENPRDVPGVRDALEGVGILTYEADVRFPYRFMMDHSVQGSCTITGTPAHHAFVDCFYEEPSFARCEWLPQNLKTLAIDIETGNNASTLYCVSLVGSDGLSKVLVVSDEPVVGEGIETYATEKTCLEAFCAAVRAYDPDIITGWSVIDFDLATLQAMCEANGVPFILGRGDEKTKIKLDKHFFRESTAEIVGRVVLDGIMLLKTSFVRVTDYKLGTAAHEILGEAKLFDGANKLEQIETAYRDDKAALCNYCRKDSALVLQILGKKQLLDLTAQRSVLTGMPLDRVKASIASLDSLYLRELALRGYAARTHTYQEKEEQITGGYVMTSQPGIYDYVIVCDFKSLYPSIMRTLNIDPLSYVAGKDIDRSSSEYILAENGAVFKNQNGILPDILERLHNARDAAKAAKNTVAVYAIKVIMNSFFGSLASPQCRFFSLEVANGITVTGQHIIKTAAQLIRDKGYEVIYGDTDSIFVDLSVGTLEEANTIGTQIQSDVNEYLKGYVKDRYKRESKLELQFEKTFVKFFMPMTRSGEASKKRYAGLRIVDGKEHIDFTGLEFVRRDWTELAKDFQLMILDRIFHGQDVTESIKDYVTQLKAGTMDTKLVYRKAIRKDLAEYTKTTPAHVKAARQMGTITSNVIEYVQTEDGPQPLDKRTSPIDYGHYIEKQLKPLANSVLFFYNTNFDDLISGSRQKGLFDF